MLGCIYRGPLTGAKYNDTLPIYDCQLHGRCVLEGGTRRIVGCDKCKQRINPGDKGFLDDWVDPLVVMDRRKEPTDALRGMLSGGSAFLVCGGPSLKSLPYKRLGERGVFSLGVNNVAGLAPVRAFTCSDPPKKFHHGIFTDPTIIKLLPQSKLSNGMRGRLRVKYDDGRFERLPKTTYQCPNVWGFMRRAWFQPDDDTWFTEPSATWGNNNAGVNRTGEQKTLATMLLGLRLLQYLGARRVFLLGCDFYMDPRATLTGNYAFNEDRELGAIQSNNRQFEICNDWLCRLRPVFDRWGFGVYNCNQTSHLRAFDYVPFEDALEDCRGLVPVGEFDLRGHYAKVDKYEEPK